MNKVTNISAAVGIAGTTVAIASGVVSIGLLAFGKKDKAKKAVKIAAGGLVTAAVGVTGVFASGYCEGYGSGLASAVAETVAE